MTFTSETEGGKEENKNNSEEEEEIPSVISIHVPQQQQYTSIREEIEAKIPFVTRRSRSIRINFKFDGLIKDKRNSNNNNTTTTDGALISSLYANVDVLPILKMIYDSIAREEATCAKDAIVVLRDSPYWDGERRDDDDDDDISGAGTSAKRGEEETGQDAFTKRYDNVCVGGTFDHAHAGHRWLLAAAVAVTEKRLDVGITGEALLENKKYKEYLQPFERREQFCKDFVKAAAPVGLRVNFGPLDENWPVAATREDVDALVVSEETVQGAEKINEERKKRGFKPLELVILDVLGKKTSENGEESKLSSTRLRELEHIEKRMRGKEE